MAADGDGADVGAALGDRLKQHAMEAAGYVQRVIADRVVAPATPPRLLRAHGATVTAVALTADAASAFSVAKDGSLVRTDVATGTRFRFGRRKGGGAQSSRGAAAAAAAPWVSRAARAVPPRALLSVAVPDDASLVAAAGGDGAVWVWDARTGGCVRAYRGHTAPVAGLAFQPASRDLYSASLDATVRIWSLDDGAYVDALHGHQGAVLCVDAAPRGGARVVSGGRDRTARVWKIADDAQLIFRAPAADVDAVRYVTGADWVSGDGGGGLALWSQLKKRPAARVRNAHPPPEGASPVRGWVQSLAVARGSDLVASGAGDGAVRLWAARGCAGGGAARALDPVGSIPVAGFVNGLALSPDGRILVAGVGPEPRLGRWATDKTARPGLLVARLGLRDE